MNNAIARVAGLLGTAAEQPQVDLFHFDAMPASDDGVTELVREDARKQQQSARQAKGVRSGCANAMNRFRKIGRAKRVGNQGDDQKPPRADADGNTGDACYAQAATGHAVTVGRLSVPRISD